MLSILHVRKVELCSELGIYTINSQILVFIQQLGINSKMKFGSNSAAYTKYLQKTTPNINIEYKSFYLL